MLGVRAYLAIAAVVAVLAVLSWSRWQVNSLRADLAESRGAITTLQSALEAQNIAAAAWKAEAARKQSAAVQALSAASVQRRRADRLAATLYGLQLPPGECDALVTLVDTARAGGL